MSVTTTNLIAGPGTLYHGAFGAAEPDDTEVNGTPAASAWTDVGGTQDGVTMNVTQEFFELMVDQIVDIPGRRLTKRDMQISTNLAEPTLDNLVIVLNGGTVSTGSGFEAYDPVDNVDATQPVESALIFDGYAPGAGNPPPRRRVIARKVISINGVETSYKKDEMTLFPVTFSCHFVDSSTTPFHIVDEEPA